MKITAPGIYRDVSEEDYRSDPCPIPSLTQSQCKTLLNSAPLRAWTENSRLNPAFEPEDGREFDLGNVAHRLVLGRGKDFAVMDFKDWRTKAAQEQRGEAISFGLVPILRHQFEQAENMSFHLIAQLERHKDRDAFTKGTAEVMLAWEEGGFWYRALVDWLHDDLRTVDDYKSSGMSMAPHMLGIRAESAGWHVQAAFIERGLNILDPAGAGRRTFRFIAQETDAPHLVSVMHMSEHWMEMGRRKVQYADTVWKICITRNQWPGYSPRSIIPDYPGWAETRWLEREVSESEDERVQSLMGG